jgi:hypothetical protein
MQTFSLFGAATSVAVADMNGDGLPDLIVANGGSVVSVLLNTTAPGATTASFATPQFFTTGGVADSVTAADVNGDGKPDLLVSGGLSSSSNYVLAVLLGNGDGTFQTAKTYPTPGGGTLEVADFNGDGKLDVAAAGNFLLLGNGDGTFQNYLLLGVSDVGIAMADFNGDGRPDLALGTGVILLNHPSLKTPTAIALISSLNPSAITDTVSFTAAVTGEGGVPTGKVIFYIKGNKPVSVPLSNGQAIFNWTFSHSGARTVTALYSGDTNFAASYSAVVDQQVNAPGATQTTLTSSLNPSGIDQAVTFTAKVTGQTALAPTGTVTFTIYGNKPVTVPLSNGVATYNWTFLNAGARTVNSTYSGDSANLPSAAAPVSQQVNVEFTNTVLTSSLNPSIAGQTVTYTAVVTGQNGGTPTGIVTFTISGNTPVNIALTNGQAQFSWTFLHPGPRTISASYAGDVNNGPSTATMVNQTVNSLPATTTVLSSSLNPSVVHQSVTYTATVTGQSGVPTGSVTFTINGNKPVTVQLSNGQASFSWTYFYSGARTVTAAYSGDAQDASSTSAVLDQTVN